MGAIADIQNAWESMTPPEHVIAVVGGIGAIIVVIAFIGHARNGATLGTGASNGLSGTTTSTGTASPTDASLNALSSQLSGIQTQLSALGTPQPSSGPDTQGLTTLFNSFTASLRNLVPTSTSGAASTGTPKTAHPSGLTPTTHISLPARSGGYHDDIPVPTKIFQGQAQNPGGWFSFVPAKPKPVISLPARSGGYHNT